MGTGDISRSTLQWYRADFGHTLTQGNFQRKFQ